MPRPLTAALAQYAPLSGADPVAALRDQAAELCSATPGLDLIVFPEIHLCGDCDTAADANAWLTTAAEPLDGPRVRAPSRGAAGLGGWRVSGSVPELRD